MHDLIIIGGGPGGLAAGIYGARAKLKTAILEKVTPGGLVFTTREIVNYPGFKETSGPDLSKIMAQHAKDFGAEIIKEEVVEVELDGDIKSIRTKKGNRYDAGAVILAVGSQPRMLNVPGERKLRGSGVSYCATCDADFYEGQHVIVVGNGDAALEEAIYLTKFASFVTVIVIHDEGIVDCNRVSAERALHHPKIEFIWNSVLAEIKGSDEVESVTIKNLKTGELKYLGAQGVFIYVGTVPETEFLKGKVDLDEKGYIITDEMMETSVRGVFAAGDGRVKYLRQVVTAVADGATAAVAAERFLDEERDIKESVLNCDAPILLLAFWDPAVEESINYIAMLEALAVEIGNKCRLVKVDLSRKKMAAQKFGVSKAPASILLVNGKVVKNLSGPMNAEIRPMLLSLL
jgi:thioredoxin reductase (NADPH)